jgi:hypothetical protein
LAVLARKYLQIPAISASSERMFSTGALIISKLRNRLNKETFEELISLKSWGIFTEKKDIKLKGLKELKVSKENPYILESIED